MKRLWVGMLLASLPLALLAQPMEQRPSPGWFNPPTPPDNSVTVAPPPPADTVVTVPPDTSVTATPLPPPQPNPTSESQEMVPNPLDNPDTSPSPGANKVAQPRGQPVRGGWVQMGSATLQMLDKVNAIQKTLVVKVGDSGHFDSLDVAVRGCFVRPSDVPADATAFLVVRDQRADAPSFTGWMVRSAPYMSMLAHPIYDIRVSGCTP
jgi:hypothetical protein